ncbi:hypothetical protein JB92DRAFT_2836465 [Gautieria morchelliformis]|nr:hypothetical protein JB92DRAFT_2836465 [Gautieria morchelliformis]
MSPSQLVPTAPPAPRSRTVFLLNVEEPIPCHICPMNGSDVANRSYLVLCPSSHSQSYFRPHLEAVPPCPSAGTLNSFCTKTLGMHKPCTRQAPWTRICSPSLVWHVRLGLPRSWGDMQSSSVTEAFQLVEGGRRRNAVPFLVLRCERGACTSGEKAKSVRAHPRRRHRRDATGIGPPASGSGRGGLSIPGAWLPARSKDAHPPPPGWDSTPKSRGPACGVPKA